MERSFCTLLIFLSLSCVGFANKLIYQSRAATSLNKVTLYPDSTFTRHSNISFEEGVLFELIGQTDEAHEDDSQNQKFKWFKVRTMDGQEGWIFGDGLAVILTDQAVDNQLKQFHKRKVDFNNGFENSVMWVASLEGRDMLHEQDYMNPLYTEFYIVITNPRNQSVHINYAGSSAMGYNELKEMKLKDLTGDGVSELILLQSSFPVGTDTEYRDLEIFSMQAGTLGKIFSESMTLAYETDMPSPALFKNVEIEDKIIRIEYIDYLNCQDYSQDFKTDELDKNKERCLEYVTYTYAWEERMKMYRVLYPESRSAPVGGIIKDGIYLINTPDKNGVKTSRLAGSDQLEIIKHWEVYKMVNGKKTLENFLMVRTSRGETGYLPANLVKFKDSAHALLLENYYGNPPISKFNWKSKSSFLKTGNFKNGSALRN